MSKNNVVYSDPGINAKMAKYHATNIKIDNEVEALFSIIPPSEDTSLKRGIFVLRTFIDICEKEQLPSGLDSENFDIEDMCGDNKSRWLYTIVEKWRKKYDAQTYSEKVNELMDWIEVQQKNGKLPPIRYTDLFDDRNVVLERARSTRGKPNTHSSLGPQQTTVGLLAPNTKEYKPLNETNTLKFLQGWQANGLAPPPGPPPALHFSKQGFQGPLTRWVPDPSLQGFQAPPPILRLPNSGIGVPPFNLSIPQGPPILSLPSRGGKSYRRMQRHTTHRSRTRRHKTRRHRTRRHKTRR